MDRFPFVSQLDSMDCGPACLKMVAKHHGRDFPLPYLRERCHIDRAGVSVLGIVKAAEAIELKSIVTMVPFKAGSQDATLATAPKPVIAHWNQNHFVVVYHMSDTHVWIADPGAGKHKLTYEEFNKSWLSEEGKGIIVLFEPTQNFLTQSDVEDKPKGFQFILSYLTPHRRMVGQLILSLLIATILQLILPFLTQSLVDIGIDTKNLSFITLVLIATLGIHLFSMVTRFLQSWLILHISTRINVSLVSDFLFKMMKLPLYFFESKNTGDLIQRINDQKRIESFLTQSFLNTLLGLVNLVVFGIVLAYYNAKIFLIFIIAAVIYVGWITLFLKYRKDIDYKAFKQMSDNQDSLIEMIQGMPEIKLQGSQQKRRMKWAGIQAKLFRVQMKSLALTQYQDGGALLINQVKDILISIAAAVEVVEGRMTLGMLLAVQYIIGQLNGPIQQMIGFVRAAQDAKISLDRLSEVNDAKDEEDPTEQKLSLIPTGEIEIKNVSFQYTEISELVLDDVSFTIPRGKTTAIVGSSGSGKTTLVKLLLRFYPVLSGSIRVGKTDLSHITLSVWRQSCGAVLQDGFLFSDTIADNVAESDDTTRVSKVMEALQLANITDFIKDLPLQSHTMIGAKGNGVSQGQKQRLFIARALYKNPEFLFFDEATNSLDATNEKEIVHNIQQTTQGKTTIIVAHRLSTVKNADQIIVLDKGKVVETGTHMELIEAKGYYFRLVSDQLELGH
jgi:ATP-binding cassette, subfamily B, bacterial